MGIVRGDPVCPGIGPELGKPSLPLGAKLPSIPSLSSASLSFPLLLPSLFTGIHSHRLRFHHDNLCLYLFYGLLSQWGTINEVQGCPRLAFPKSCSHSHSAVSLSPWGSYSPLLGKLSVLVFLLSFSPFSFRMRVSSSVVLTWLVFFRACPSLLLCWCVPGHMSPYFLSAQLCPMMSSSHKHISLLHCGD